MPPYAQPSHLWLQNRLKANMNDVAALKKQGTEYIVNQNLGCVAIIGNIEWAPETGGQGAGGYEKTGLTGWGIAVLVNGAWVGLPNSTDSGWIEPTLLHSAVNLGGEILPVAYRKQGNTVRLRGGFKSLSASGKELFTLPAGYRPTGSCRFVGYCSTGSLAVEMAVTGSIVIDFPGSPTAMHLDGCTFTVD